MTLPSRYNYILVPGLGGSGEEHWQTLWAKMDRNFILLEQDNWTKPHRTAWIRKLKETVEKFSDKPIILITHSMAFSVVVEAAADKAIDNIAGAFCVAPADLERKDFPAKIESFLPPSRIRLPFKCMIVASENDPYCSIEKSGKWANITGAKLINVGKKGHLDSLSEIGTWDIGQNLLLDFLSILD